MVLAGLANAHIECSDIEIVHIDPPFSNSTCINYLGPFMRYAGGVLRNPTASTDCLYCPVDQTNQLLQQLGLETEHAWRNAAYMVVYIVFNTLAIFFHLLGCKNAKSQQEMNSARTTKLRLPIPQ
ncbi:hypothetical protein OCU04_000953 [Sclerotinia nivalis]|uniref:Uncharacterized protein n=1 Tax=Sclerotinia nivalis TaxID=352851 RepID=A0A9X0AX62_9HELO|nr:hypothetical protein OCU04_000953 [Sclerotinia nivalis]